jgi:hypothetical protein
VLPANERERKEGNVRAIRGPSVWRMPREMLVEIRRPVLFEERGSKGSRQIGPARRQGTGTPGSLEEDPVFREDTHWRARLRGFDWWSSVPLRPGGQDPALDAAVLLVSCLEPCKLSGPDRAQDFSAKIARRESEVDRAGDDVAPHQGR